MMAEQVEAVIGTGIPLAVAGRVNIFNSNRFSRGINGKTPVCEVIKLVASGKKDNRIFLQNLYAGNDIVGKTFTHTVIGEKGTVKHTQACRPAKIHITICALPNSMHFIVYKPVGFGIIVKIQLLAIYRYTAQQQQEDK